MQTDAKQYSSAGRRPWVYFAAGGSGAVISTVATFPFDVVKTRFQSDFYHLRTSAGYVCPDSQGPPRRGVQHMRRTTEILKSIYKREGWRTLFKGLGPNLCSFVPESAIGFYAYGNSKRFLADTFNNGQESMAIHLYAAAFSGIATETCTNPLWVIKTRLQLDRDHATLTGGKIERTYKGSWDCARTIMQNEGLKGLYRGLTLSYLGVTEFMMQWVLYERMKLALRIRGENRRDTGGRDRRLDRSIDWVGKFGAAGVSKLIATVMAYPHEAGLLSRSPKQHHLIDASK